MAEGSETMVSSYMVPTIRTEDSETAQLSTLEQDASVVNPSGSSTGRSPGDNTRDQLTLRQSFFRSSNGVSTAGGQFVNATNVNSHTYNYYGSRTGEIDTDQSPQHAETTLNPRPGSTEDLPTSYPGLSSFPNSLPIMNSLDIYGRHLAVKRRGYPLWVPDPDINSPLEYQRQGVSIGDVGIITSSGEFDFMFNICQSSDHPFNVGGVPDDFEPFKPTLKPTGIRKRWNIKVDSFIASTAVTRSYGGENETEGSESQGLEFKATASEGAILAVPHGALSEDLRSVVGFRRYISGNLLSWYRYTKSQGWEVENGDIRLVIGTDKTSDWGMAVFTSLSDEKDNFRLNFKPAGHRSRGAKYNWECSGNSEAKSGPDAFEIDALGNQADGDGEPAIIRNQCLFVRTLNPMLRDDIWKTLESEFETAEEVETSRTFNNTAVQFVDSRYHPPCFFDSLNVSSPPSRTQGGSGGNTALSNAQASANVVRAVHLANLTIKKIQHPSKSLNEALLKQYTGSKMVITDDNDWINAITLNDEVLPSSDDLVSRILVKTVICQEEGVLFLESMPDPLDCQLEHGYFHFHDTTDSRNSNTPDLDLDIPNPDIDIPDLDIDIDLPYSFENTMNIEGVGSGNLTQPPLISIQQSWEVYYRQLVVKKRGTPLRYPMPNPLLPLAYLSRRICVGDVGILTDYGGFHFLFNICLPRDHSDNPDNLPDGFSPLSLTSHIEDHSSLQLNNYISSSVKKSQRHDNDLCLISESSAEDTPLVMPWGSKTKGSRPFLHIIHYIANNAELWYRYAHNVLCVMVQNGDLRLVVGRDESTTWGMATFTKTTSQSSDPFRTEFQPSRIGMAYANDTGQATYNWECDSGMTDTHLWADSRKLEELQVGNLAEEGKEYENQYLFVQTFDITLGHSEWNKIISETKMRHIADNSTDPHASPFLVPQTSSSHSIANNRPSMLSIGQPHLQLDNPKLEFSSRGPNLPKALAIHPSKDLHRRLLRDNVNARMVITNDHDWTSVLVDDDMVMPSGEELYRRILECHDVQEEEGVIFLQHIKAISEYKSSGDSNDMLLNLFQKQSMLAEESMTWAMKPSAQQELCYKRDPLAGMSIPVVGTEAMRRAARDRSKHEASFFCTYPGCPSTFTRKHNLNRHLDSHRRITVPCLRCGARLVKSSLTRHNKTCKNR